MAQSAQITPAGRRAKSAFTQKPQTTPKGSMIVKAFFLA
jgi:hypothetical protein